jgi:glycine cleavage system H lipoate-binding protein
MVERTSTASPRGSLFPPGERRCVWMEAGVLSYRLCDQNFDCEHCPLELALRGAAGPSEPEPQRRYHRGHLWARLVGADRLQIGINAFLARLLGRLKGLILPSAGGTLVAGQPGAWAIADDEPLPLQMPVSGTVTRRNPLLELAPALAVESPTRDGWLLELVCAQPAERLADLLPQDRMRQFVEHDKAWLQRTARRVAPPGSDPLVGETMADGGEPKAGELRRLLGPARYHELLLTLLSPDRQASAGGG